MASIGHVSSLYLFAFIGKLGSREIEDMEALDIFSHHGGLTPQMQALLLDADPDASAIARSIAAGQLYCARLKKARRTDSNKIIALANLIEGVEGEKNYIEISHIAVAPAHRGRGVGRAFMGELLGIARKRVARERGVYEMRIATGNSSLYQLRLYQRCGFRIYGIDIDYFAFYDPPIFENGVQCLDRIKLRAVL